MESDILTEILRKLNARLRRERRTIVLLMDNAPCHPEHLNDKFSPIKIVFLPKNTTSRLQPLDLGIIQTFKLKVLKAPIDTWSIKWMIVALHLKFASL